METKTPESPCEHGIRPPVVCPQCRPEAYERARPHVVRYLWRRAEMGLTPVWTK